MMRKTADRRGLTLIEVLAVIGIVALLFALLLPALGAIRSSARTLLCRTRMGSLALAVQLYHDTHGLTPPLDN